MSTILGMFIVAGLVSAFFTAMIVICYIAIILLDIYKYGLDRAIHEMDPISYTFCRWWMTQRRVGKALGAIPIIGILLISLWYIFEFCSGLMTWACFISSLVVFVPLWIIYFMFRNKRFPGRVVASAR